MDLSLLGGLLSVTNFRFFLYFFWACVACSAFLFPANIENAESPLYKASDLIAEAKFIRKNSDFPAATAATYVVSVVSGFALALMAIFSKVLMRRAAKLILLAGQLRCFVCSVVLLGISFSMIFIGAIIREGEKGEWFLRSISESRIHLAWWCSAFYFLIASSLVIFIASVGILFLDGNIDEHR